MTIVLIYLQKPWLKYSYLKASTISSDEAGNGASRLIKALNYYSDVFFWLAFLMLVNSIPKLNIYHREADLHYKFSSLFYNFILNKIEL